MAHTHTLLYYHFVYSTKHRQKLITPELEPRLHAYLGGIVLGMDGKPIKIGGIADHVHLLVQLPSIIAPADAVRDIKADSSAWVHREFSGMQNFAWQVGYGGFTVSKSKVPALES